MRPITQVSLLHHIVVCLYTAVPNLVLALFIYLLIFSLKKKGYSPDQKLVNLNAYEQDYLKQKDFRLYVQRDDAEDDDDDDYFITRTDSHGTYPLVHSFPGTVCKKSEENRARIESETDLYVQKNSPEKNSYMGECYLLVMLFLVC